MDDIVKTWRADTPGCEHRNHLNNAGAGLMPGPVLQAIEHHIHRESTVGGYEAADAAAEAVADTYAQVALLVGAAAANIAVVENATAATGLALSAFDFDAGDVIVTTKNDYVSNQLMYLSLQRRSGVVVRRAADLPEGGADPDSVRVLARDPRCRLVAVTWVPTNSGLVQPVAAIGEVCESLGVPYLVDACQAVGQMPVDVARLRCDFLTATARKFLRGPRGIGFLYVSDRALARGAHPLLIDLQGATWLGPDTFAPVDGARRFENWEFAYALVLGMGAAARYALGVGLEQACGRARALAERARVGLAALPGARVLDRGLERCAIVSVALRGWQARDAMHRLRARGINTSAALRQHAVIDMDEKGAASALRVSPHYYNTEAEVETAVEAIHELLEETR